VLDDRQSHASDRRHFVDGASARCL
jgi:hypothetical protein